MTTPPQDHAALVALVAEWRDAASRAVSLTSQLALNACANQLEAALAAAPAAVPTREMNYPYVTADLSLDTAIKKEQGRLATGEPTAQTFGVTREAAVLPEPLLDALRNGRIPATGWASDKPAEPVLPEPVDVEQLAQEARRRLTTAYLAHGHVYTEEPEQTIDILRDVIQRAAKRP
jgi:hypothetical protein